MYTYQLINKIVYTIFFMHIHIFKVESFQQFHGILHIFDGDIREFFPTYWWLRYEKTWKKIKMIQQSKRNSCQTKSQYTYVIRIRKPNYIIYLLFPTYSPLNITKPLFSLLNNGTACFMKTVHSVYVHTYVYGTIFTKHVVRE